MIPVVVEISVRIQKGTINNLLEYQYNLKLQEEDGIEKNFSKLKYFQDILSNVRKSQEFRSSDDFLNLYGVACSHPLTLTSYDSGSLYVKASYVKSVLKIVVYASTVSESKLKRMREIIKRQIKKYSCSKPFVEKSIVELIRKIKK